MEYRFQSNKTLDDLRNTLSSNIYKDRLSAVDSSWDKNFEEKGKIFYGEIKDNNFTFKRLPMGGGLIVLRFNGEIIQKGNQTEIIGRFNYYFILNNLIYIIFLIGTLYLGIKGGWIQNNLFSFFLLEIGVFIFWLLPFEVFRRREKRKVINFINSLM